MSAYYSTQATIEAKVRASRVKLWGDKNNDGTLDPVTLTQGLQFAKSHILAFIWRRYGESVTAAWTDTTAPELLRSLSDDLTLYYIASGANAVNPVIKMNYDDAIAILKAVRDYQQDIPGINDDSLPCTVATAEFDDLPSVVPQTALIVR